jgi:ankyrin repeat protein
MNFIYRSRLGLITLLSAGLMTSAATLTETLQQGLIAEENDRNLSNAITAYEAVLRDFGELHRAAATAVFRLAECYSRMGRTNDAIAQYQRVINEFSDESSLTALSRQRLQDQGAPAIAGVDRKSLRPADQQQIELLDQESKLIQRQIDTVRKKIEVGRAADEDLLPLQRDLLKTQRQIAEIEGRNRVDLLDLSVHATNIAATANETAAAVQDDAETSEIKFWEKILAESPDLVNRNQGEPLRGAAARGQLKVATYLLDHGADVAAGDPPALLNAVLKRNREMVELLVRRGAPLSAQGRGISALHLAAGQGWLAGVKILLDAKSPVNEPVAGGYRPLHFAAFAGNLEIVKLLLDRGAEVNAAGDGGTIPLQVAVRQKFLKVADLFLEHKADPERIGECDIAMSTLQQMISLSRNLQYSGVSNPAVPLMVAAWDNNAAMIELLVRHGARFSTTNRYGQPVLELWVASGSPALISQYAKSVGTPVLNRALLNLVGNSFRPDVLDILVSAGAQLNITNSSGNTPLCDAVKQNQLELADWLMAHGANVNHTNAAGCTVLHLAAMSGNPELVEHLLQHGAALNATTPEGYTPLDLLAKPSLLVKPPSLKSFGGVPVPPNNISRDLNPLIMRLSQAGAQHSSNFNAQAPAPQH